MKRSNRASHSRMVAALLTFLTISGVAIHLSAESSEVTSFKARENTHFDALDGQVISMGDRWAFMPSKQESDDDSHSGLHMEPGSSPLEGDPELMDKGLSPSADGQTIILVENLMLQQIVQAIRADAADRRWRVSGVYLEFFDENRLMILSAKRASVEPQHP
ncbi:MAG: hypothetical protein AAF664_03145 [Planctomycetota bacterium]